MLSSRMFWKLFVAYAVLNLATTITFVLVVSSWLQGLIVEQVTHRLHDAAILASLDVQHLLPLGRTEVLQRHVQELGRTTDMRFTLIAMDGKVIADSEQSTLAQVGAMENHKDRLELVQAAATGIGTSQRDSPTLDAPTLYLALRIDHQGKPIGFARTAQTMTKVHAQVAAVQRLIWLAAVALCIAAVALTYFVAARVVRPLRTLTQAAESIAAGNYQHGVYLHSRDELGMLADAFRRMMQQLESREAQLRESRQRLEIVLEGMEEGVIALDAQEHIVLANAAAGRLLGFSPGNAAGRPLLEVVRSHTIHEAVEQLQQSQEPRQLRVELGDNDRRVIGVNASLLTGELSTRVILVLQDITESQRLESMRQEFVANVSHELKTPLSAIKAYAETLVAGAIHDQEHNLRFVERIEEQAERLHQLILDLLSLAQIESGKQAFEIEPVEISGVARSCLAEHQVAAETKHVRLHEIAGLTSDHVRADKEGLRQILNNLIDNAVKYTPEGGEVTVRWHAAGDRVVIEVSDTGIGIAADQLPRVFERFYRVDKARSRELGGTGLGLSIVKHLVQAFGGSIHAESKPGQGSRFSISLPKA